MRQTKRRISQYIIGSNTNLSEACDNGLNSFLAFESLIFFTANEDQEKVGRARGE